VIPPPGESAKDVINDIEEESGEVLLIDTEAIGKSGNLSEAQMKALDAYDKAAVAYEKISADQAALAAKVNGLTDAERASLMPAFEEGEKKGTEAKQTLLKAQKAFLKAFPQLQLTK
jgi:hypothetical protein